MNYRTGPVGAFVALIFASSICASGAFAQDPKKSPEQCQALREQLADLMHNSPTPVVEQEISRVELQLRLCGGKPTLPVSVTVEGFEITQAIQDINNSVPLVAGKETWARVYVNPSSTADLNVVLQASAGGASADLSAPSPVSLDPVPAGSFSQRRLLTGSINIKIPAQFTVAGQVKFTVKSVNGVTEIPCPSCGISHVLSFANAPPLVLQVIGFQYNVAAAGKPAAYAAPRPIDFDLLHSWLKRAYPVSEVKFNPPRNVILKTPDGQTATSADIKSSSVDCNVANAELSAIRTMDMTSPGADTHTHYYGFVFNQGGYLRGCAAVPDTPDPAAPATGPTGAADGSTGPVPIDVSGDLDRSFGDWYGGHEISHTFGRNHPGFCNGNSASDPAFPYPNGQISNGHADSYAGFDVGDAGLSIPPSVIWVTDYDIMTYCNQPLWLSAYTSEGVSKRLLGENPGFSVSGGPEPRVEPRGKTDGDLVHIVAIINLTRGEGRIAYVIPVAQAAPVVDPSPRVALVFRNAGGKELSRQAANLREDSDTPPGADHKALVDAAIPLPPLAAALDLVLDGKIIASYRATAGRAVPIRNLRIESAGADSQPLLRWDGPEKKTSAEGPTTYTVQVSRDGQNWKTVAVGLTTLSMPLETADQEVRVFTVTGFSRSAPILLIKRPR
jgi:hypothetical protein